MTPTTRQRDPAEPDEAERARIEEAKAAARAEKAAQLMAMRDGPHRAEGPPPPLIAGPGAGGAASRSDPASLGCCPRCGKPYGSERRRCYACHPGGKPDRPRRETPPKAPPVAAPAAPRPPAVQPRHLGGAGSDPCRAPAPTPAPAAVPSPPSPPAAGLERLAVELGAMNAVANALKGLDPATALRVVEWARAALRADWDHASDE